MRQRPLRPGRFARRVGYGLRLAALLLASSLTGAQVAGARAASPGPCAPLTYAGASYTVCTLDLRRYALKLFLKGPDGAVYGSFDRLAASPAGHGLVFAMNAGMYHEDRSPVGLYVEDGRTLQAASTASGFGNFHMKPNGVFYAGGTSAGILETSRFLARRPAAKIATQSGPMLVIDGKLHPRFLADATSRKIRNGVGIRDAHTVVFAISEDAVTFMDFARLFRDGLGCRNALYLDGSISSLYAPALRRADVRRTMGPIIGAVPR